MTPHIVQIPAGDATVEGLLELPSDAKAIILFAHGSGSSRHSPRNSFVARVLHQHHLGTLLLDLLTIAEDLDYQTRFDIELLTERLVLATAWVGQHTPATRRLSIGYFGASTGAAAALRAAAQLGPCIGAVVSRGGRPDLAGADQLALVSAPTLLLVGSRDEEVLALNQEALASLSSTRQLSVIPGATHLFEETGTLEQVAEHAAAWFCRYLKA